MKHILTDRALNREILRLSVPSILANLTVPLGGMVDTALAGHLQDDGGGAAVFLLKNKGKGGKSRADNDFVLDDDDEETDEEEPIQE